MVVILTPIVLMVVGIPGKCWKGYIFVSIPSFNTMIQVHRTQPKKHQTSGLTMPTPLKYTHIGCGPLTVTVTTRIITFLVGDPYKPSFTTVTVRGPDPIYTHTKKKTKKTQKKTQVSESPGVRNHLIIICFFLPCNTNPHPSNFLP